MKIGRPRTLADLPCAYCGKSFRPRHATTRFCSLACGNSSRFNAKPPRPLYTYSGRLSEALQREVSAARAEAATAPLYRPGNVE
jgi:hypothetical protein